MDNVSIIENAEGYAVKIGTNELAYLLKERFQRSDAEQLKSFIETAYERGCEDGKHEGYNNGYDDGGRDAVSDDDD